MSLQATARTQVKRVLLIDAVSWAPGYPLADPRREVQAWFARWLKDQPQVQLHRVQADDDVLAAVRSGMHGVILSGSPRDAWSEDPINYKLSEVILWCRDHRVPFLGVCYGHQLLGRALGGIVARHPLGLELGNTSVELTPLGQQSPLFRDFPPRFEVLSSHADAVLALPPECALLVRGDFTVNQGFHWRQQLFGVQFHPETDPEILRFIWSQRRESWRSKVPFDLDQRLDTLQPTPQTGRVLRNFVQHYIDTDA